MRVLAHSRPGPAWRPGRDVWEQGPAVEAHLAYLRGQYDSGALLAGGPLRGGMAGMALSEVPDLEAAHASAADDPGVVAQVLAYEVAEVVPYCDALSGVVRGPRAPERSR